MPPPSPSPLPAVATASHWLRWLLQDGATDASAVGKDADVMDAWATSRGGGLGAAQVDPLVIAGTVAGGVILLIYALSKVSTALRAAFGPSLTTAIRLATSNRVFAFCTGCAATAALTSATATSILTLQFVNAGAMTFQQSLAVSLGINVGATVNAHLLTGPSHHHWGPTMCALGYLTSVAASAAARLPCRYQPRASRPLTVLRHVGDALFGVGLLFLSMGVLSDGLAPLRRHPPFIQALGRMSDPASALVASACAAVVFQSSNTVIALTILLGRQGILPLPTALLFVCGCNIGTCVTSLLAAVGMSRDAVRSAVAYTVFKVVGVGVVLVLMTPATAVVEYVASSARLQAEEAALGVAIESGGLGAAANGVHTLEVIRERVRRAVLPLQIAVAHTLLNAFIAALFLPLLGWVSTALTACLPAAATAAHSSGPQPGGHVVGGAYMQAWRDGSQGSGQGDDVGDDGESGMTWGGGSRLIGSARDGWVGAHDGHDDVGPSQGRPPARQRRLTSMVDGGDEEEGGGEEEEEEEDAWRGEGKPLMAHPSDWVHTRARHGSNDARPTAANADHHARKPGWLAWATGGGAGGGWRG